MERYGCANPKDSLALLGGLPSIGSTLTFGIDNPIGTQGPGSVPLLAIALDPDPGFPCGTLVPGTGMARPGAAGELLLSLAPPNPILLLAGPPWSGPGSPAPISVGIPNNVYLTGIDLYVQGILLDPTAALGVDIGLTDALELQIGP